MAKKIERLDFTCCYQNWMVQQEEDLKLLLQAASKDVHDNKKLQFVVEMVVQHFEEYHKKRMAYARRNSASFCSPTWCSSFKNSCLWVTGCRPSLFIRLLYTLSGSSNCEAHLDGVLQYARKKNLVELFTNQLSQIDDLHIRTIQSQDSLSSEMENMQENITDSMFVEMNTDHHESDIDGVFDSYELFWLRIIEKVDNLRLNTMKEILNILTPSQAVEFLIASKKLQLSMHQLFSA
ncbi:hypothetical protein AQUCO_02100195v1, partial [Aquilegia coerulea]